MGCTSSPGMGPVSPSPPLRRHTCSQTPFLTGTTTSGAHQGRILPSPPCPRAGARHPGELCKPRGTPRSQPETWCRHRSSRVQPYREHLATPRLLLSQEKGSAPAQEPRTPHSIPHSVGVYGYRGRREPPDGGALTPLRGQAGCGATGFTCGGGKRRCKRPQNSC